MKSRVLPWEEIVRREQELRPLTIVGDSFSDMNRLLDLAKQGDASTFVAARAAVEGELILGWAICDIYRSIRGRSRDVTLFNVFVHPDHRCQGLGKSLLREVLDDVLDTPTPKVVANSLDLIWDHDIHMLVSKKKGLVWV